MKHDIIYLLLFAFVAFLLIIVTPLLHPIAIIKAELKERKQQP